MSEFAEIMVLVEGTTEQIFIKKILKPYLAQKYIFITPVIISKSGQKGGDVRFDRVINDIGLHLKQRRDTYLTLFIDYYGIKGDWPGLAESKKKNVHTQKAETFNRETKSKVAELFADSHPEKRFIPYVSMHEFEALLFSNPKVLAEKLNVEVPEIEAIVSECGEPENINDSSHSAPSKRLERLYTQFKKTSSGIAIAQKIGLDCMRQACPLFNEWLTDIENLVRISF